MKFIIGIGTFFVLIIFGYSILGAAAIGLWTYTAAELFIRANTTLAFREFMLTLYGMNYLLSPALTYHNPEMAGLYPMKISEEDYFSLAIPAMLALRWGLFWIKTEIFSSNFQLVRIQAIVNQEVLKFWLIGGIILKLSTPFFPGELGYVVYLISLIRFVAAFGLFAVDARKYRWYLAFVLVNEMAGALRQGMFHDTVLWIIFFGLFWVYLKKPSVVKKISLGVIAVFAFIILQVSKSTYRAEIGTSGAGFSTFQDVATQTVNKGIFEEENINSSVNRVNQAWILASTINHMNYTQDFQGLRLVGLYTEAALLPRFLAPNKLSSGNKAIFRKYSGHYLRDGTSMGLGVLGDGYIAFGYFGTVVFCLALGLLFGVVFKMIERWAQISPFFILFTMPILSYAVRPDCETQTIITHLVKSTIVFGLMMLYYRKYFTRRVYILTKQEEIKKGWQAPAIAAE